MISTIKNLSFLALTTGLCCTFATDGWAQASSQSGGFGAASISRLRSRSTGNGAFSVKGIQNRDLSRSVSRTGVQGINQRNFLSTATSPLSRSSKPFSSISRGPAVSPYLALSAPRAAASDYQTIIRPQQRKQRENQRQQAFAVQRQQRLNQMAARAPYSTTGDENSASTGHAAVFQSLGSFQNTGNYFPPPSRPKQR